MLVWTRKIAWETSQCKATKSTIVGTEYVNGIESMYVDL
jgi:hypothetical protein